MVVFKGAGRLLVTLNTDVKAHFGNLFKRQIRADQLLREAFSTDPDLRLPDHCLGRD